MNYNSSITLYYVNQSGGGGKVGSVYRASFRVQVPSSFVLLYRCCIKGPGRSKKSFKTGSNIITDMLNKDPKQPVGIFLKIDLVRQKTTPNKK
jgi:hypothetical protein